MRILDGGIRAWKDARFPMKVGDSGIWTALFPACVCADGPHEQTVERLKGRLDHASAGTLRGKLNDIVRKGAHVTLALGDVLDVDQKIYDARQAIYEGKYDLALRRCMDVLDLEAENESALEIMGSAFYLMDQRVKALQVWERVMEINPDNRVVGDFLRRLK